MFSRYNVAVRNISLTDGALILDKGFSGRRVQETEGMLCAAPGKLVDRELQADSVQNTAVFKYVSLTRDFFCVKVTTLAIITMLFLVIY